MAATLTEISDHKTNDLPISNDNFEDSHPLTVFMSSTDMILSQNCFLQVQRGITKKIHIQELWLLCSAHHLMMPTIILV